MAKRILPAGFTIVEMMLVVVAISILVAIVTVSYSSVQDRSRQGAIQSDLRNLVEAMQLARIKTGKTLQGVTGTWWTGQYCMFQSSNPSLQIPNGTDFSQKTTMTQQCWDDYAAALQKISDASGTNVTTLLDPWKRPYYIDENDDGSTSCSRDALGWLSRPYVGGYAQNFIVYMRPNNPACPNASDTVG